MVDPEAEGLPASLTAPSQHPIPAGVPATADWHLRVDGLVQRPLALTLDELRSVRRTEHRGSYTCERGWEAGPQRWQGVPLADVLAAAGPEPTADAFYAHAAGFRSLVPLEAVPGALLALDLDGHPLTVERGAPCRLVVVHAAAPLSIKWVERLELIRRGPGEPVGPPKA